MSIFWAIPILGENRFSEITVDIPVGSGVSRVPRVFTEASAQPGCAISASAFTTDPKFHALEIVDAVPQPVRAATWGRLKAIYR